jgi:hypothetical protein
VMALTAMNDWVAAPGHEWPRHSRCGLKAVTNTKAIVETSTTRGNRRGDGCLPDILRWTPVACADSIAPPGFVWLATEVAPEWRAATKSACADSRPGIVCAIGTLARLEGSSADPSLVLERWRPPCYTVGAGIQQRGKRARGVGRL